MFEWNSGKDTEHPPKDFIIHLSGKKWQFKMFEQNSNVISSKYIV